MNSEIKTLTFSRKDLYEAGINAFLKASELTIFKYLISRRNEENGKCFPSLRTIIKDTHYSKRTIQRAINTLIEKGFVNRIFKYREDKGQTSNQYDLFVPNNKNDKTTIKTTNTEAKNLDNFTKEINKKHNILEKDFFKELNKKIEKENKNNIINIIKKCEKNNELKITKIIENEEGTTFSFSIPKIRKIRILPKIPNFIKNISFIKTLIYSHFI